LDEFPLGALVSAKGAAMMANEAAPRGVGAKAVFF
jgi:hypothetical protein